MKKFWWTPAFALVVVLGGSAPAFASSQTATTTGPAFVGALNMLHDGTMTTVGGPMFQDNAQGNAGMFHATCLTAGAFCPA